MINHYLLFKKIRRIMEDSGPSLPSLVPCDPSNFPSNNMKEHVMTQDTFTPNQTIQARLQTHFRVLHCNDQINDLQLATTMKMEL